MPLAFSHRRTFLGLCCVQSKMPHLLQPKRAPDHWLIRGRTLNSCFDIQCSNLCVIPVLKEPWASYFTTLMPCLHVPTQKFDPKFGLLKFNIVVMVMGPLTRRMGVEPMQPEFQSDLANCKHLHRLLYNPKFYVIDDGLVVVKCEQSLSEKDSRKRHA